MTGEKVADWLTVIFSVLGGIYAWVADHMEVLAAVPAFVMCAASLYYKRRADKRAVEEHRARLDALKRGEIRL